jgi:predicted transcriptional regulator
MEVRFTPEQEQHLAQIAVYSGTDSEQLVRDAALRIVAEDMSFRAAVRRGIEQADRGETLSHEEIKARIDRLLSH